MEPQSSSQTIAFTLAISCHICLGKVKQPVTCSNHHVFCRTCLDVWLERNPACPSCRVPITPQNPYTTLIGGADPPAPSQDQQWDLLRARVEISLRGYEQEIESQKSRNSKLERENRDLLNKLAKQVRGDDRTENLNDFTVLNDQLRDMSQMYDKARKEISELKRTNRSLTDQNVNLTRESERLRLEVSKRSPQKFGRITVATLQNKLDESEKKVKQLQKALEKTDEYVSELHQKIKDCHCSEVVPGSSKPLMDSDVDFSRAFKPEKTISCQRNLMSSLDCDKESTSSQTLVPPKLDLNRTVGGSTQACDVKYVRSAQVAAMRVASSKIENSRMQSVKNHFQSVKLINSGDGFGAVPTGHKSPTKRMRPNFET